MSTNSTVWIMCFNVHSAKLGLIADLKTISFHILCDFFIKLLHSQLWSLKAIVGLIFSQLFWRILIDNNQCYNDLKRKNLHYLELCLPDVKFWSRISLAIAAFLLVGLLDVWTERRVIDNWPYWTSVVILLWVIILSVSQNNYLWLLTVLDCSRPSSILWDNTPPIPK